MADNLEANQEDQVCNLATFPKPVLENLFKTLNPGDPEKLRLACADLNTVYLQNEGHLHHRQKRGSTLALIGLMRGGGVTLKFKKIRGEEVVIENPSFQRFLKFMRHAESLNVGLIYEWQDIIPNNQKQAVARNLLKNMVYKQVVINGFYPTPVNKLVDLLPDSTNIKLFANKLVMGELTVECLRKLKNIHFDGSFKVPVEIVLHMLDHGQSLHFFNAESTEYFDAQKYIDQWKAGTRNITRWTIMLPKPVFPVVNQEFYRGDEVLTMKFVQWSGELVRLHLSTLSDN